MKAMRYNFKLKKYEDIWEEFKPKPGNSSGIRMCSHIKDNLSGNMPVCSNADCQQPAISSASFDSATNIGTRVRRMRKLDRGE
ncbi:uncharacterized protein TNCV_1271091 [Trichonephila clavipes]|nr:uncharacterized protein TNCV_1271091 [Trichonephila clavipes]